MLTQTVEITFEDGSKATFIGPAHQVDDDLEVMGVDFGEVEEIMEVHFPETRH